MRKILLVLVGILFASCSHPKMEGPTIYFSNASSSKITDIRCDWAGRNALSLPVLNPGDSRSQPFHIASESDFFGTVQVSWRNAAGTRNFREFLFNKNNLPSISDRTTYSYVQFYLDQHELEVVSSDAPDLQGKTNKMNRILKSFKGGRRSRKTNSALIKIEAKKINSQSLSEWLENAH